MTDKPTDAQIEEFWEWCGFKYIGHTDLRGIWEAPDGGIYYDSPLPIDLKNLFKYAVPKVSNDWQLVIKVQLGDFISVELSECVETPMRRQVFIIGYDPALALFWALDKIRRVTDGKV